MKMKQVITVARKTSPMMNMAFEELRAKMEQLMGIFMDFNSVHSESSRVILIKQCVEELRGVITAGAKIESTWKSFDDTLARYTRKFDKAKKKANSDLPGQTVMEDIVRADGSLKEDFISQCENAVAEREAEKAGEGVFVASDQQNGD